MTRRELERRLLDFVNRTLLASDPDRAADAGTALFEEGIVTSLRILDLIAFVENATGVKVPDDAVRLANFGSVRAIAAAFGDGSREDRARTVPPEEGAVLRLFARRAERAGFARPLAELESRGELVMPAPGRAVLRGMPLGLLRGFDSVVQGWAGELGAESRRFPRRIPIDALERAGRASRPTSADRIVPPAVCYHVYPAWQGRRLTGRPALVTARGRCFREERSVAPLERLRDFEMREIVALGSREEVESFRHGLIARVSDLVARLELEGRIETASDPFFVQEPAAAPAAERAGLKGRGLMQQVLPLKYELRLALDASGYDCAVASFNHHLDFFGRRFDIRLASGAPAHSGCVAFGLERWVLAFLSQHGTDPRRWPDAARELRAREEAHARLA